MTETPYLLEAAHLTRRFGDDIAVNNINFNIKKGEVLGLLGPNGAGKTTTMKMLTGNLAPNEGQIIINGVDLLEDPQQAKSQIGYLPETPPLYKEYTVNEFLLFCARLNQIAKSQRHTAIDFVLQRCGLTEVRHRLIANLSKGFQQRVGIAQAIIHNPAVVILDEPTSGLDPLQIREIRQLIRDIANEHSVILSTHILPEVQMLCDRVQIIAQGNVLFNDSIDKLSERMQSSALLVEFEHSVDGNQLVQLDGIISVDALSEKKFRLHYSPERQPTQSLLRYVVDQAWPLIMLTPEQHSLEDVFMKIIQQEEKDV